jgi:hypothetical protein
MHRKSIIPQGTQPKQAISLVFSYPPKLSSFCVCKCLKVKAVYSSKTIHYARWNCCNGERFRGWVPKPTNLTATQAENQLIDKLLASGRLNNWEIGFCWSVKGQKERGRRPLEKLEAIATRLGIALVLEGGEA